MIYLCGLNLQQKKHVKTKPLLVNAVSSGQNDGRTNEWSSAEREILAGSGIVVLIYEGHNPRELSVLRLVIVVSGDLEVDSVLVSDTAVAQSGWGGGEDDLRRRCSCRRFRLRVEAWG